MNVGAAGRESIDVTVVTPMHQSANTVAQTVESALADFDASGVGGEIVVVNDGSTDAGPAIVDSIARRDARVRLVHRNNGGLSAARNTGLAHAAGRFLRFLDADDLAAAGGLACLLKAAERTGAACGGQELIDEAGRSMGRELSPRTGADRTVGLPQLATGNAMGVGAVLVARELIGTRRFDERLPVCEDWDLWLRLAGEGVRFAAMPAWRGPVIRYRVRPGSLSKRFALMHDTGARVLGMVEGVDVGEGRRGLATGYATMLALAGDIEGGIRLLGELRPRALGATALASDAFAAVLLGLGQRPEERGARRREWAARADRWWDRLAEAGWAEAESLERAWRELARLVVAPAEAAAACVEVVRAVGDRGTVVMGLGKNGRRVVEALDAAGMPWTVRDEAITPDAAQELDGRCQAMTEPIPPDAAVIVTPEHDQGLLAALDRAGVERARIVRWHDVLANLSVREAEDLCVAANRPQLRCV